MKPITAQELQTLVDGRVAVTVVNTLPPEEFEREHVPGSVNVPEADPDFVNRVRGLVGRKDAPVVVYCASPTCTSSTKAAEKLEAAGFSNILEFEGGIQAWKEAQLPLQ